MKGLNWRDMKDMATLLCGICLVQDMMMVHRHSATVKSSECNGYKDKATEFDDLLNW